MSSHANSPRSRYRFSWAKGCKGLDSGRYTVGHVDALCCELAMLMRRSLSSSAPRALARPALQYVRAFSSTPIGTTTCTHGRANSQQSWVSGSDAGGWRRARLGDVNHLEVGVVDRARGASRAAGSSTGQDAAEQCE